MPKTSQAVKVSLIETATIPATKGRFLEASLEHEFAAGDEVVFEQQSDKKLALAQSIQSTAKPALSDQQVILKTELKLDQQILDVDAKELEQLENLLLNSDDVFAVDDSELGQTSLVQHTIDTGAKEGWYIEILCQFSQSQCCHEERCLSSSEDR